MERKLLKKSKIKLLLFSVAIMTFGFLEAQTISTPIVSENPLEATFTLTNGGGGGSNNKFQVGTEYYYILIPGNVSFGNFYIQNPPIGPNASANYTRQINAPLGTQGGNYTVRVNSINPNFTSGESNEFTLFNAFEIDDQSYTGYIQCQTPAVSYRLVTITNTGNIIDKYNLTLNLNVAGTEWNLGGSVMTLDEEVLTETPVLMPNESFTFIIRLNTLPGTPPNKDNYADLIIYSDNDNSINISHSLHTWIYCGNGNNIPGGANSPDLKIAKTSTPATVGDEFIYTITMNNKTTKNALTPTIIDTIPDNLTVVDYYLGLVAGLPDTRNIYLSYDEPTRLFQATYPTNNQNKFDSNSRPIRIYIKVIPNCYASPSVVNTVHVYNFAGDADESDNISSVITNINFDTSNPAELGIWQGSFSDDWFDCRNWSKGLVPDSTIDVTIPPNTAPDQQPNINDTDIALTRSITIEMGATLSMEANSNLHISGNWTNNGGTLIPGTGTVSFVGLNTNQTIFDLLEEPSFYNLTVNTSNNVKVLVADGQGLFVNNQLSLQNGVLRLEGLSQLVQPEGASVTASLGKLWRNQKGHANMFNYNYWSSPVGTNASQFTIGAVMKDGSNLDPQNIQWTPNRDVTPTTPITISTRWLYTFVSTGPLYANWQKIMPGSTLNAGQGYTMKGSGINSPDNLQNYTFEGVPFTGDIPHTISNGQVTLLGNPYASALDAEQFINDNQNTIEGTLEFWDHFQTTNSHYLDLYMGGYAKYNLASQIAAVNANGGISSKVPTGFLPVGQGFFVAAKAGITHGSQIVFKNSQRAFVKEDDAGGMHLFGMPDGTNATVGTFDGPSKIKLNLITAEDYKHQIAIGFMQDKATEGIDYGYDSRLRDTDPNQFYFMHPEAKLLIQGVGYFDEDKKYPIGIIAEFQGRYTFSADQIENLDESTPVYLYDNEKQIYHNLRNSDYLVNLIKGEHNTRFSLRFKNHILENSQNTHELLNAIVVYRQNDQVVISNPSEQLTILNARMYNVLGQEVTTWAITNGRESYIELPLRPLASGIYIVQVQTDNGTVSKKINIR